MRKLLKFLLVPALASQPVITVVACNGTNQEFNDNDIRLTALNTILDSSQTSQPFQLKDLGLNKLPTDGTKYSDLAPAAKDKILKYYSNLVSSQNDGGKSPFPTVAVVLTDNPKQTFQTKIPDVLSNIELNVTVTYKGVSLSSDPTKSQFLLLNITDERGTDKDKVQKIANFLKTKLQTYSIALDNLPYKDPNSNVMTNEAIKFVNEALYGDFINSSGKSYLGIPGVTLEVISNTGDSKSNNYTGIKYDQTVKAFTGTMSNLNLLVTYKSNNANAPAPVTINPNLNFYQNTTAAGNQLSIIVAQTSSAYRITKEGLIKGALPLDQNFATYVASDDKDKPVFIPTIQAEIINNIQKAYAFVNTADKFTTDDVTIDKQSTSPFSPTKSSSSDSATSGTFNGIGVTFVHNYADKISINATAAIQLYLTTL